MSESVIVRKWCELGISLENKTLESLFDNKVLRVCQWFRGIKCQPFFTYSHTIRFLCYFWEFRQSSPNR